MEILTSHNESVFDIAAKHVGNADAAFVIIQENGLDLNKQAEGVTLLVTPKKNQITDYLDSYGIATDDTDVYSQSWDDSQFWNDFKNWVE